jgi:hypothetical protein
MGITGWARLAAALLLGLAALAPAARADTAWPEFRAPGADFAVSLPEKPEVSKDATTKDGRVSRRYRVIQGATVYTVAYDASRPTPAAALDGWLDNIRNKLIPAMKATLRDERRFSLGDARGMELILDVPTSDDGEAYVIRARYYVKHPRSGKGAKDMLYRAVVVGEPGSEADNSATRFLDSFHFVEG